MLTKSISVLNKAQSQLNDSQGKERCPPAKVTVQLWFLVFLPTTIFVFTNSRKENVFKRGQSEFEFRTIFRIHSLKFLPCCIFLGAYSRYLCSPSQSSREYYLCGPSMARGPLLGVWAPSITGFSFENAWYLWGEVSLSKVTLSALAPLHLQDQKELSKLLEIREKWELALFFTLFSSQCWESCALTDILDHLGNLIYSTSNLGNINLSCVIFHYENLK
jgi:hypothetical protein